LRSRANLAAAYRAAGRIAEAIGLFEETLIARELVLGRGHPDTLHLRSSLANAYRGRAVSPTRSRSSSRSSSPTSGCWAPITPLPWPRGTTGGRVPRRGPGDRGDPLFEQTLAARERLLGADHLSTVGPRGNLAAAYHEAGREAEAVPLFEQTVADWERLLGSDHTETLKAKDYLAAAYRGAGRLVEAVLLIEQTLEA
jgi:tetratricopeptide (TPR) repeat protein